MRETGFYIFPVFPVRNVCFFLVDVSRQIMEQNSSSD